MDPREKINEIIKNISESSNKELIESMEYLQGDFEQTKITIIKLTHHLDNVEVVYDKILKEYEGRNIGKKL